MKLTPPLHSYTKGCRIWLIINIAINLLFLVSVHGFFYKLVFFLMTAVHLLMLLKPYKEENILLISLTAIICLIELFAGRWLAAILIAGLTYITIHFVKLAYNPQMVLPSQDKKLHRFSSHSIGIYIISFFLILVAILWIIVAVIYLAFPEQLYPYYYGMEYIWYGNTNFIEDKSLVALIGVIFHITQIWLIVGILLHFVIIANIFGLPLDICPIKRRTIPYYKCLDNAKYYVIFRNSLTISTFLAVISIISTIPRTEATDMTAGLGYISLFFLLFLSYLAKRRIKKTKMQEK